ncbi:transmembrane protein 182 isoform X1 [Anolis carolinensis]|uniref:transmembrane protein 182 isoform X1 n=2 Tax=Anolis carolinensis TaxID=28377 RepID=UPI0002039F5F|nr:PREDICTED: transmembrane protein 182 isoform X1 [Anolis carolinensis]|eukprot:XP_003224332.1 PREDICTED: transmembrane protein 182 isoform X1 [Anolis carolinensis]
MKLSVGIFFGGLFGALGILLFLVAFGTDYWLLATEVGRCSESLNDTAEERITFHHEGFFWRCWFDGKVDENTNSMWKFWYTNQSPSKNCTHAYLSPFPLLRDENNSTAYNSAIIYRGFWSVLLLLGVVTVIVASFFIICAAPFGSHVLYKTGGGFFIAAGILFTLVVVLYVIWVQAMANLENYVIMKKIDCPDFSLYARYGWSFMLAPVGIFFTVFSGMLFLLVGRTIYLHSD